MIDDRQKILIVDDQAGNLYALEKVLGNLDADIIKADGGNDALSAALNHRFALAIVDVQMPDMNGYELAEWLRTEEKTREVPIIFISAVYSTDYHVFKGYEAGAVDFLVKPYNPKILLSKAKVFLQLDRQKAMLKQSREQLALANDTLELKVQERTAELEQFAFVISHDLQEPLRMVASFVQLLEKRYKGKLDEAADEYIRFAVDGANRMREMITGILHYSRINTTGMDYEWVDCDKILDRVISGLTLGIKEANAVLTRDPLPRVWGDPIKLHQLFQNLITNSIKFRSDNPLRIHFSNPLPDKLSMAFKTVDTAKSEFQLFSVQDNGIGFEQKHGDRVFEVFQRLHGQGKYPGTGIGLSICKKIILHHGGRIWAESEPDKGTCVYFTLWEYEPPPKNKE